MITERDDVQQDERPALVLSLVASIAINLLAWMLVIWGWTAQLQLRPAMEKPELIVSSSSIRLERRTVPQPQTAQAQQKSQPQHMATPKTQQMPRQQRIAKVQPQEPPRELAREVPQATPEPPAHRTPHEPASLESQLAQQEQMFAREAQRLNASHSLSVATAAPQPPSSFRRTYFDANGRPDENESATAVLDPVRHWLANGMSCYYVHYVAQYSGGGSEEGTIPWPLCYPANHDAMLPLDRTHTLPIPAPPRGYVLPPNVTLQPLLRRIYNGEITDEPN